MWAPFVSIAGVFEAVSRPAKSCHAKLLSGSLPAQATNDCVWRACGCGDNTIGHWTRWCPIPLIVAHAILKPSYQHSTLNSIALINPRNTAICTLILA